jgi:hypothetical protein
MHDEERRDGMSRPALWKAYKPKSATGRIAGSHRGTYSLDCDHRNGRKLGPKRVQAEFPYSTQYSIVEFDHWESPCAPRVISARSSPRNLKYELWSLLGHPAAFLDRGFDLDFRALNLGQSTCTLRLYKPLVAGIFEILDGMPVLAGRGFPQCSLGGLVPLPRIIGKFSLRRITRMVRKQGRIGERESGEQPHGRYPTGGHSKEFHGAPSFLAFLVSNSILSITNFILLASLAHISHVLTFNSGRLIFGN